MPHFFLIYQLQSRNGVAGRVWVGRDSPTECQKKTNILRLTTCRAVSTLAITRTLLTQLARGWFDGYLDGTLQCPCFALNALGLVMPFFSAFFPSNESLERRY